MRFCAVVVILLVVSPPTRWDTEAADSTTKSRTTTTTSTTTIRTSTGTTRHYHHYQQPQHQQLQESAATAEWRAQAGPYTPPWVKPTNYRPPAAWRGIDCYAGSVLHDCPYPKLCFRNSTCVLFKTGKFLEASVLPTGLQPLGHRPHNTHRKGSGNATTTNNSLLRSMKARFRKMCPKFDGGDFVRGRWKKACAYPWLSAREMRSRVAGRHIAVIGDSMLRQLFMRFVWHARGYEEIIESYFHTDAFYVFNGTHDHLAIQQEYSPALARTLLKDPVFALSYTWDSDEKHLTKYPDADLRVTFPTYWNVTVSRANDSVRLLRVADAPGLNALYGTVPQRVAPAPEAYSAAVAAANAWIKRKRYYLPLEEMSRKNVFLRNEEDGTHFQCGMIHHWGEQASGEFKSPVTKDCRDMVNLNLVMLIVHYLNLL